MIKKNLLVKVPDQLDKRNKLIYLTDKGRSLQEDMIKSTGIVYMDAIEKLSEKDIKSVTGILQKMKNNLSE
jgi:DNA-binding MarR family transcriptional regulator